MAGTIVNELRAKSDAAAARLGRQLQGMDGHMERSNAPGEWTAREVLSHLLSEADRDPVSALKTFSDRDLPTLENPTGRTSVTEDRRRMTPKQFVEALERQRQAVFAYLDGLSDAELTRRKARIPFFKQFMGTDEIPIQMYVGALLDLHWNDHAGQLAKIRKAVGLPEVD